jgi:glycosyltransferase involved in cell wall biosynthesis
LKRVLYIDGVGVYGGACRSLFENIRLLKGKDVDPYFIIQKGSVLKYYGQLSNNIISVLGISRFDNTEYSYYKGIRWLILLREIFFIPFTLYAFINAKLKWGKFDIIHVNELTEILPILLSKFFFNAPIIVHCRSLYHNNQSSKRNKIIELVLKKCVSCLIAIDQNVYDTIPKVGNRKIINNSYSPISLLSQDIPKSNSDSLRVGYVGSLSRMKGIYELIECFKLLKKDNLNISLLVAGDVPKKYRWGLEFFLRKFKLINQNSLQDFKDLVKVYRIENKVTFLGHVNEISQFYNKIDVLCFPSHLDAPGRPIIEAAYFSIPSIVTVREPKEDTLIHKKTGIAIPTNEPKVLRSTLKELQKNIDSLKNMGTNAKSLYLKNFEPKKNVNILLDIYKNV